MSKALTTLVRELRLKDAWFVKNKKVEFTYISSVCYGRSNKIQIVNIFISAILNHLRILKLLLGNSLYKRFTPEFCNISQELMCRYQ